MYDLHYFTKKIERRIKSGKIKELSKNQILKKAQIKVDKYKDWV